MSVNRRTQQSTRPSICQSAQKRCPGHRYNTQHLQFRYSKKCAVKLPCFLIIKMSLVFKILYMLISREPKACLLGVACICRATFKVCQTAGAQLAHKGRLQLPGPGSNTFPPEAAGEAILQDTRTEQGAGRRYTMSRHEAEADFSNHFMLFTVYHLTALFFSRSGSAFQPGSSHSCIGDV